jgi:hypothetical protein
MDAAIFWLADDDRFRRAMRTHRHDDDGQCIARCGRFPCLMFHLANAARALHEARVRAADRLTESPTMPMRAVPLSVPGIPAGRHRQPTGS